MALAELANEGALNGTTAIDVVPSPASGHTFIIRGITVCNRDTAGVVVIVQKVKGANTRRLAKVALGIDESMAFENIIVLDATDEKVQVVLASAIATTNPDYDVAYADRT